MVFRYDLSIIPEQTEIYKATLCLYCYEGTQQPGRPEGKVVEQSWDEATTSSPYLTMNSQEVSIAEGYGSSNQWMEFEVTNIIQNFINNPGKNYGIALFHDYESVPGVEESHIDPPFLFHSSQSSEVTLRPKLVVTYGNTANKQQAINITRRISFRTIDEIVNQYKECTFTVFDIIGREIASFSSAGRAQRIDLSSGAYIVAVSRPKVKSIIKVSVFK